MYTASSQKYNLTKACPKLKIVQKCDTRCALASCCSMFSLTGLGGASTCLSSGARFFATRCCWRFLYIVILLLLCCLTIFSNVFHLAPKHDPHDERHNECEPIHLHDVQNGQHDIEGYVEWPIRIHYHRNSSS